MKSLATTDFCSTTLIPVTIFPAIFIYILFSAAQSRQFIRHKLQTFQRERERKKQVLIEVLIHQCGKLTLSITNILVLELDLLNQTFIQKQIPHFFFFLVGSFLVIHLAHFIFQPLFFLLMLVNSAVCKFFPSNSPLKNPDNIIQLSLTGLALAKTPIDPSRIF